VKKTTMRGLSEEFLEDLDKGRFAGLTNRIRLDHTLDLQIRNDYVNIYYRGGNLMKLELNGGAYTATFDQNYGRGNTLSPLPSPMVLKSKRDIDRWLDAFQDLKLIMDHYFSARGGAEREAQQLIVRENNFGKMGTATDYFICDIEYAREGMRFDMIGVHWPSTGSARKKQIDHRLVLIEVKYGDGALKGEAGLKKHVDDIDAFLADEDAITACKQEMLDVFSQKCKLKLINCRRDLKGFSEEPPQLMLILANHDPDSQMLRDEIKRLPEPKLAELCIATSNFMGYGLFYPAMISLDELRAQSGQRV
jgi:hypothetical protein